MLAWLPMYASRFVLGGPFLLALSLLVAGFGCKTGKAGKVPVASPMSTFEKPEREDIFPEDEEVTEGGDLEGADGADGE